MGRNLPLLQCRQSSRSHMQDPGHLGFAQGVSFPEEGHIAAKLPEFLIDFRFHIHHLKTILSEYQIKCNIFYSDILYCPWVIAMKIDPVKYERIRNCRIDRGLTQKEVAAYLNIKQNTYSQYETGTLNYPLDVIVKLARLYHTSVDYLLELTDEPRAHT